MSTLSFSRRRFMVLTGTSTLFMGNSLFAEALQQTKSKSTLVSNQDVLTIKNPLIKTPMRIIAMADSHITLDDARGTPYVQYSKRMGGGGAGSSRHVRAILEKAKAAKADIFIMPGDIFSFPSEAGVEFLKKELDAYGRPWMFITGNHDWHYEGTKGTPNELRKEWVNKRLLPLYQEKDPMMATMDIKGVRMIAIDNSTNEISPAQLAFYKEQVASGLPCCLFMHIPLYQKSYPNSDPSSYGCGHPKWNAANDPYWQIERRHKWPELGHSPTTKAFCQAVKSTPNLIALIAGHTHAERLSKLGTSAFQIVAPHSMGARYFDIALEPAT